MLRVSVIIPTYNRENFIVNCVQSVRAQSSPACEIIVVDDGSIDRTYQNLKEIGFESLATDKPSLRYIYQENKGVSAARNLGIKEAHGEYIAILDSDDFWLPTKLERQVAVLVSNKAHVRLCHTDEIWLRNGKRVNPHEKHKKQGGEIFLNCLKMCCISPSSVVLHKSVFDDFGVFDENLPACEDYDFWLRYCANEEVIFVNDHLIIKNGGHTNQLSHQYWGMDRFRVYALEKLVNDTDLKSIFRLEAIRELIKKLNILINGAKKRNNSVLAENMIKKKTHWEEELLGEMDG